MNKDDVKILRDNGWFVECESPFEIRNQDGSFATNRAAEMVLDTLREHEACAVRTQKRLSRSRDTTADRLLKDLWGGNRQPQKKKNNTVSSFEFHGTGYLRDEEPPITGMSG